MKILALNCGSSSIKYRLFDSEKNFQLLKKGLVERIGQSFPDHRTAMLALFSNKDIKLEEIEAVGHRVVHGGESFKEPTLIDAEVIAEISKLSKFAPLHCEPNVIGIQILQELLPTIPHVAIFDTSAHSTLDSKAFLYGIPLEFYEKHKIRKYGFHGINHAYVAAEAAQVLKKPFEELKIITCHLGNGCSITAFEKGKSIDTSMGLTPLEGLLMGTRSGDLDPSIVIYLSEEIGLDSKQITDLLNKKSGLLGLCGKNDMRDIIEMAQKGNKQAQIALDIFVYRVQKYIGAYIAVLNGVDAVVFTGGIGENSPYIRSLIAKNFTYLGIVVDPENNENNKSIFSGNHSSAALLNIPANEEVVIAKQTYQLLTQNKKKVLA